MKHLFAGSSALRSTLCAVSLCWTISPALGQSPKPDRTQTSLEALLNMEVSSASRKQEKFFTTSSALFVIRPEDIRRSGATNIPDLLRMVPGLEVAQIDSNQWAIGARGFSSRFANKLVVLIDSRTVYPPLFSGVYGDIQDVPREEIERPTESLDLSFVLQNLTNARHLEFNSVFQFIQSSQIRRSAYARFAWSF